jgi:hypothetical protein
LGNPILLHGILLLPGGLSFRRHQEYRLLELFSCISPHVLTRMLMFWVVQIVNDSLYIPDHIEPDLADLLTGLLCKGITLLLHHVYYPTFFHELINYDDIGFQ